MTINKIALSVVAAAITATSTMGAIVNDGGRNTLIGTLTISGDTAEPDGVNDKITVASELLPVGDAGNSALPGININNLDTNGDLSSSHLMFTPSIEGSGTASDPIFVFEFPGDTGLTAGNAAIYEYDTTTNTFAMDSSGNYIRVAELSSVQGGILRFQGDSNRDVTTGKTYVITNNPDAGSTTTTSAPTFVDISLPIDSTTVSTSTTIDVNLFSGSGTEDAVSYASIQPFESAQQYSVVCISKLDGMINFENSSKSFVATGHGIDTITVDSGATTGTDAIDGIGDVNTDSFIFSVTNNQIVNDIEYFIDGVNSVVTLTGNAGINSMFGALSGDLVNVTTGASVGTFATATPNADDITFTFTSAIPTGTTRFNATITTDHSVGLVQTPWVGTMKLDDTAGISTAPDDRPVIANNIDAGQWKDYIYTAQIAGAETGGVQTMKTKFYITNRSCQAVQPTFRIIRNGSVTSVTMTNAIQPDTQDIITLADVFAAAGLTVDPNVSEKCSVEIDLPGTAEDFYVYAQVKNGSINQFKDLPVYSTSVRD